MLVDISTIYHPIGGIPEIVSELGLQKFAADGPVILYEPRGCEHCGHTGYQGRTMIVEWLAMDDAIRGLIMGHAGASEIQKHAIKNGMTTMYDDGLKKNLQGITTIEEVIRVTQET